MDQHSYRSASNSLLASTADRTPKTFALQGDPGRSTFTPSIKLSPYIVSPRYREDSSTFEIPYFVAKMVAKVRRPNVADDSHPILIPVKLSSQP
ncbi:hypothetical protein AVEN_93041-1 [Araneus ventricosus]|uniref:Uncharacterized protein n=1 Tax=Araneus ventricosus TaxID=182803 RepID=A0A4Y2V6R5_ARAVE|nr:hypothetical protein AVEN_93041-1 [Araneus ventricosus]